MSNYDTLRYRLLEIDNWPVKYMFKFIVPNQDGKVDRVIKILEDSGDLSFKHTKSLSHVSVTCVALMNNADEIIDITEQAGRIEGVMVL